MTVESTNFDGDWDSMCEYCGNAHRANKEDVGELEGVRYVHRLPCEQEKYEIKKRAVAQGIALRAVLSIYALTRYVWQKIPFKKEARLIYDFLKSTIESIRAVIYL